MENGPGNGSTGLERNALAEAVSGYAAGSTTGEELSALFVDSTVYCHAGAEPGFLALGESGAEVVPVFSSLEELARFAEARGLEKLDWLSTNGADILGLLPEGYGLALDLASETPLILPASAIDKQVILRQVQEAT
jgi:hypothetical protein